MGQLVWRMPQNIVGMLKISISIIYWHSIGGAYGVSPISFGRLTRTAFWLNLLNIKGVV